MDAIAVRKRSAAVLFLEVAADKPAATDYIARGPDGRPIGDVLYLTPPIERPDPCVEMRKRFGR